MEVISCVSDSRKVLDCIRQHKPDVVTLDLAMPDIHGSDLLPMIQSLSPDTRVIVLTGLSDPPLLAEVYEKAPHAIMQKMGNPDELLAAVRASRGRAPILCAECRKMFDSLDADLQAISPLSQREREIVRHLARGETTKEVALSLGISEHTVRKHRENAMAKFGAKTTGQLVALAARRGYID